jgi:orotate phosphoribosyltransferase
MPSGTPQRSYQLMNYRGMNELELALQTIALRLPPSVRLVVGIPRSGLLAATMLALHVNLPVTDVAGFLEGRLLATGRRRPRDRAGTDGPSAVVVDDSVASGHQIRVVRRQLAEAERLQDVIFAAPFVSSSVANAVDLYGEIVEPPRAFAWNILHHPPLLERSCVDIDGVLCLDPSVDENDDGTRYRAFLRAAQPLFLPSAPVRYIVTSRLERYREETAQWLAKNEVQYSELVMLDLPDAVTRRALRAHAGHKADFYAGSDADLFVESDYGQAIQIAARAGRQVFAIDRREMVYPSPMAAAASAPSVLLASVRREPPVRELEARYWAARARLQNITRGAVPAAKRRLRGLRR